MWDLDIQKAVSRFSPAPVMFGNEDVVLLGPSLWQDDYYQNWILRHSTVSDSRDRTCTMDTMHTVPHPSALPLAQMGTHTPDCHHC